MDDCLETQNWLVTGSGICTPCAAQPELTADLELALEPYRLYRFLTDLEDILRATADDQQRLQHIQPLVRRLLTSSYWLQFEFINPSVSPGWSVKFLYQEHDFPITVQMVAWLPGNISPIHNHGAWGLVALVSGQEKNRFWRPAPTPNAPNKIEPAGEKLLLPGDIIGFLPDAIHSVEPVGDEPAVTFNLYGETDYAQRFEFDPIQHLAKPF